MATAKRPGSRCAEGWPGWMRNEAGNRNGVMGAGSAWDRAAAC
jgi:hypothetical protein